MESVNGMVGLESYSPPEVIDYKRMNLGVAFGDEVRYTVFSSKGPRAKRSNIMPKQTAETQYSKQVGDMFARSHAITGLYETSEKNGGEARTKFYALAAYLEERGIIDALKAAATYMEEKVNLVGVPVGGISNSTGKR